MVFNKISNSHLTLDIKNSKSGLFNLRKTKFHSYTNSNSIFSKNDEIKNQTKSQFFYNDLYSTSTDLHFFIKSPNYLSLKKRPSSVDSSSVSEKIQNAYFYSKRKTVLGGWPPYYIYNVLFKETVPILKSRRFHFSFNLTCFEKISLRGALTKFVNYTNTVNFPVNQVFYDRFGLDDFVPENSEYSGFLKYSNKFSAHIAHKEFIRYGGSLKSYPFTYLCNRRASSNVYNMASVTKKSYVMLGDMTRFPVSKLNSISNYLIYTTKSTNFESWKKIKTSKNYLLEFYAMSWHFFKLKIERFFFKQIGIRLHVWFLNIWDIFLTGMESYWQYFKFEDTNIRKLTRRGRRYLIEKREDAKFYIRSMVLALTLNGGVKLFLEKIAGLVRNYRNNWAFITYTMESLRLCANFFWFRFFLNYKITFQGKIGGILRAEKKTFKKGNITIENRHTSIAYHRAYPKTKFGIYNLSFWLQYKVPNLIGTFEELELISTMKILLRMYTVPWLANRLAHIIKSILIENDIKARVKLEQLDRRKKSRLVLNKEVGRFKKKQKKYAKKRSHKVQKIS